MGGLNLNDAVMTLLYMILFVGLWLSFSRSTIRLLLLLKTNIRRNKNDDDFRKSILVKHINTLLSLAIGDFSKNFGVGFIAFCITLFAVVFLLMNKQSNTINSVLSGLIVSLLPYMVLRLRLYTIRIESSYEGEFLISELINQYKLNYFNMVEAIEATVKHLDGSPRSKKLLFTMSIKLKSYRNSIELSEILDEFTYAVDTQWSRMLVNNLMLSIDEGFMVTSGLTDIQSELKRAKSAYEKSERNTTEGFAIAKIFIPGLYICTIFMSSKYFNFTVQKFMAYQVFTPVGLKMFMANLVLFTFNMLVMILFKKRKFDIA